MRKRFLVFDLTCPGHSVAGQLETGSEGHLGQSLRRTQPHCL